MMNNDSAAFSTDVVDDLPYGVRRVTETFELRDGVTLSIKLWLPTAREGGGAERGGAGGGGAPQRVGVVLEAIPYRKDDISVLDDETRFPYFAGHGIAGARLDLRGSGSSTGVLTDEYSTVEQADIVEAVEWLAAQPWCNGSVGMMGISWSGFNALQVAARRPEPLKAIITACSSDDRYDNDVHYHGGAPLGFYMNLWGSELTLMNMRPPSPEHLGSEWFDEWVTRLQSNNDFTSLWLSHPHRDSYWKQGSVCEDYSAIECPVLIVGGWADAYTDTAFRLLENLDAPVQALLGPWGHTWPERPEPGPGMDFLARCVRWWKRWLHDEPNGAENDPRCSFYVQDFTPSREDLAFRPGRWFAVEDPASVVESVDFPFGADGRLGVAAPNGATVQHRDEGIVGVNARHYLPMGVVTDLPPVQDEDDARSLTFETESLAEPLSFLGSAALTLRVASDSPTAQVFVRITDVDEEGHSHLVARGGLNLTHRDGHAPDQVRELVPGRFETVNVPLKVSSYRFAPGHRLRVAISTGYWPWLLPAPDHATLTIDLAGSALTLPVLDEGSSLLRTDLDLGEPVISPPPQLERAGDSTPFWEIERSENGDVVVSKGYRGTSRTTLPDGWSFATTHDESVFALVADDPLSAKMERRFAQEYAWGDRRVEISLESTMTTERDSYTVVTRAEAMLDGTIIFRERTARETPRGL